MNAPDPAKLRLVRWVLVGAAVLLTAANLMALVERTDPPATEGVLDRYTAIIRPDGPPSTQPADEDKKPDSTDKDPRVERICKRRLFSPDPPAKKFEAKLSGVLGDTAYLDGSNAVKVGGDYKDAKLTAIGPDWASFDFEGKEHKLYVFGPGGAAPSPAGPPRPAMSGGPPRPGPTPPRAVSGPRPPRPSMPAGFKLSPEMIARAKAEFAKMSPEEQKKALESAPPEILEQLGLSK